MGFPTLHIPGVSDPNFVPVWTSKRLRSLNSTKAGHSNFQTSDQYLEVVIPLIFPKVFLSSLGILPVAPHYISSDNFSRIVKGGAWRNIPGLGSVVKNDDG